jgi:hypothetical protein
MTGVRQISNTTCQLKPISSAGLSVFVATQPGGLHKADQRVLGMT